MSMFLNAAEAITCLAFRWIFYVTAFKSYHEIVEVKFRFCVY